MEGKPGVWQGNIKYGRETGSIPSSRKFSAFPGSDSAAAELTLIIFSSAISSYFISLLIQILRNLLFTNTDVTRSFYTLDNNIFSNNFISQCSSWWQWWSQIWPKLDPSSWLNCALRDDDAVYWLSIGHYEAVAVGNWWYSVSRGHLCLYILHKVEIWTGVTDAWLTDSQSKDSATQLLTKYKSGALVTQLI